jgi:hypothetical protein
MSLAAFTERPNSAVLRPRGHRPHLRSRCFRLVAPSPFRSRPIAGAAFGQRVRSRIILSIAPMIKTVQPACKVKLAWVRPKLAARNTSRGNALVDAIDADAHFIPRCIRRESAHPPPFHRYRDGAGAGRFTRGAPARRLRRPRASRVDAPSVASAWAGSDGRPSGTCCRSDICAGGDLRRRVVDDARV